VAGRDGVWDDAANWDLGLPGGGLVRIVASGTVTINGDILADGFHRCDGQSRRPRSRYDHGFVPPGAAQAYRFRAVRQMRRQLSAQ